VETKAKIKNMKRLKFFAVIALFAASFAIRAADTNSVTSTKKPTPYPLNTCAYDGMKLGSMGDPYVFVYQGQEIKLCCAGCKSRFLADPDKYMKPIKDAEDAQKKAAEKK
jgi:hypothetical protein